MSGVARATSWPLPAEDAAAEPWLWARAFGESGTDLNLDFSGPRPGLITALLAATLSDPAGRPYDEDTLWEWTLVWRLQGVLATAAATYGLHRWIECRCKACGEPADLALDLAAFQQVPAPSAFDLRPTAETRVTLRLPTGSDQLRWLQPPTDAEQAGERMARDLVLAIDGAEPATGWTPPAAWIGAIGDALEERDPLTALSLQSQCPECGAEFAIDLDLEGHLLQALARQQARLMDQVHRLASAYHWSEAEILALPPTRRAYYLQLLGEET